MGAKMPLAANVARRTWPRICHDLAPRISLDDSLWHTAMLREAQFPDRRPPPAMWFMTLGDSTCWPWFSARTSIAGRQPPGTEWQPGYALPGRDRDVTPEASGAEIGS